MQQLEEANPKLVEESVLPSQIVMKSITLLKRNQAVLQGAMKVMENVSQLRERLKVEHANLNKINFFNIIITC